VLTDNGNQRIIFIPRAEPLYTVHTEKGVRARDHPFKLSTGHGRVRLGGCLPRVMLHVGSGSEAPAQSAGNGEIPTPLRDLIRDV
jgi:hypothetical protein